MKTFVAAICVAVAAASAASASDKPRVLEAPQNTAQRWTVTYSTETRYFSWRNSLAFPDEGVGPGRGSEIYTPFAMQMVGTPVDTIDFEFVARGGWVRAVQSTAGRSGNVQTLTDTVVSSTATYFGWPGIQPFLAISANLPTGKSALLGAATNARMDPDLVDITSFGEGYNLGPTLGFNLPITRSLLFTASFGQTWRGRFERETVFPVFPPGVDPDLIRELLGLNPTQTINPGDNRTVTAGLNYENGPIALGLTGTATWETPTSVDDRKTFKPGIRYLLSFESSYIWPERFGKTRLDASFAHSTRNKVLLRGGSDLITETLNSNSNLYRAGIEHLFPIGEFVVGPTASVLYRDQNGYNSATLQFVPPKVRWSAGLLAQYRLSPMATLNARIEGVWTREKENPSIDGDKLDAIAGGLIPASTVPAIFGTGWQVSLGINFKR
jgi:opacity protein-like surface antigen